MKKSRLIPLLFALNLLVGKAFAQLPEPGSLLVGASIGTVNFSTGNSNIKTVTLSGTPQLGVMVTRNLAIGLGVPFFHSSSKTQGVTAVSANFKTTQIGVSPFARYYVTQTRLRPYLTASAGQNWFRYKATGSLPGFDEDLKDDFFFYNAGVGFGYFINRNISLDATVLYNGGDEQQIGLSGTSLPSFTTPEAKTVSVQFGFNIFL